MKGLLPKILFVALMLICQMGGLFAYFNVSDEDMMENVKNVTILSYVDEKIVLYSGINRGVTDSKVSNSNSQVFLQSVEQLRQKLTEAAQMYLLNLKREYAQKDSSYLGGEIKIEAVDQNKKLRDIFAETGADHLLIAEPYVALLNKSDSSHTWKEKTLCAAFRMMGANGKIVWESPQVPLFSLDNPNFAIGKVEALSLDQIVTEIQNLDYNDVADKALYELSTLGKGVNFILSVPLGVGINSYSKSMQDAFAYNASSLGIPAASPSHVEILAGLRLGFRVGGNFYLGLVPSYFAEFQSSSDTFSDIGIVSFGQNVSGFSIAPMIAFNTLESRTAVALFSIEPSVSFVNLEMQMEFGTGNKKVSTVAGLAYGLDLRYFFMTAKPGKFDGSWGMGMYLGFKYAPELKNSSGTLYYQTGGTYYVSDGSIVLPLSRKAEYFSFSMGFEFNFGFAM